MGVDWYTCPVCGDTFPDCGPMVWCDCGRVWCSDECAEKDGHTKYDDNDDDESDCKFCRLEDAEDSELLKHCLQILGKTRVEIVASYYTRRKEDGL